MKEQIAQKTRRYLHKPDYVVDRLAEGVGQIAAAFYPKDVIVRLSFWGLNVGLVAMVVTNLFPGGVLQFLDVVKNGYWHARGPEFLNEKIVRMIEWLRLPGDLLFINVALLFDS